MRRCPYCSQMMDEDSQQCPSCGSYSEVLDLSANASPSAPGKKLPEGGGFLNAALSFFVPGCGQLFQGQMVLALIFFCAAVWLGLYVHPLGALFVAIISSIHAGLRHWVCSKCHERVDASAYACPHCKCRFRK